MNQKLWLLIGVIFACWGLFSEWYTGYFWSVVGKCPYIYPDSPLVYTSWKSFILWGLGGLQCIVICNVVKERKWTKLGYLVVLVILALLWLTLLSLIGV